MLGVPVLAWGLALVLAVVLAGFQYLRLIQQTSGWQSPWRWAFLARTAAWLFLILLLFNPWWVQIKQWVEDPVLLIYTDDSRSVSTADSLKWQADLRALRKLKGLEIQEFRVSDKVLAEGGKPEANTTNSQDSLVGGRRLQRFDRYHTNMVAVLQHANGMASHSAVAGVVWMTDGIYNEGRNPQFEPIAPGIPLFTIGAGDPNPQIDASVEKVQCNEEAFLGNTFQVEVSVKSQRLQGQTLRIQLRAGGEVREQLWLPNGHQDWKRLVFEIQPKTKGLMPIEVRVIGGNKDQNPSNNQKVRYVKVVDERKKVVVSFAAPHPDVAAMKSALELGGQFLVQSESHKKSESEADVYILHGWRFQNQQEIQKVRNWLASGKALWLFATESQNTTALSAILGFSIDGSSGRNWQEVQPHWNDLHAQWGVGDQEVARWMSFPPVFAPVSKFGIPPAGEALLYQRWSGVNTQIPLMAYWKKDEAAIVMFQGEGIWRWRIQERSLHGEASAFDGWVRRTTGMLASASMVKKPIEIVLSDNTFDVRDRVIARVVCRDKAGVVDDLMGRNLKLFNDQNQSRTLNLTKGNQGWTADVLGLAAGKYRLVAQTANGNAQAEVQLAIVDQPSEVLNTQANHGILKQLAQQTEGGFFDLKNTNDLAKTLTQTLVVKPVMKSQTVQLHWWEFAGWLLGIVLLFGVEWAIRRYLGKY